MSASLEHDLTTPIGKRVECFICGKSVTIGDSQTFTASLDGDFPLYLHALCFRARLPDRIEILYRDAIQRIFNV